MWGLQLVLMYSPFKKKETSAVGLPTPVLGTHVRQSGKKTMMHTGRNMLAVCISNLLNGLHMIAMDIHRSFLNEGDICK